MKPKRHRFNDPNNTNNQDRNMTNTNITNNGYVIGAPPAPKQKMKVLVGGSNRGARENITAFAEFNRESRQLALVPTYTDPLPGRALALRDEAEKQGVEAKAIERRIEEVAAPAPDGSDGAPVTLNLDRASAIAHVLHATGSGRTILGYLLIRVPSGRLWAIRFVLERHDEAARQGAIAFFEQLAAVSERNTSGAILGDGADPTHRLLEPQIRRWFADHTKLNLAKIAAGVEPATSPLEVTTDGRETLALHVVAGESWSEPAVLAAKVLADPSSPIRRGTQFVIAEVTRHGVRLHEIRRRTDDRVSVGGADVIDRESMEIWRKREAERIARAEVIEPTGARSVAPAEAQGKEIALAMGLMAVEVIARAARDTLSRTNPVRTTD